MANNVLFKKYDSNDYIEIAEQTARWIKTTEVVTEKGKYWKQVPTSKDDFSNYALLTEKALYGGSAGIGLFYIRLYQATGKAEYLQEAKDAAEYIINTDEGVDFYNRNLNQSREGLNKLIHVNIMAGWSTGLYNGPLGGAWFILKLYEIEKNEKYKNYIIKAADDLLKAAKKADTGIYWSDQNDLYGDGGFILFLVSVYEFTKDEKYIEAAKALGDYIEAIGKPAKNGGRYWKVVEVELLDFPKNSVWVNLAHGTSGIGWLFAALYKATKVQKYLDAAVDAAKYIEGIAVGDDDAALVPYLDNLDRGPSNEFYYLSTCHGPAGTSLLFQALYNLTGDKNYIEWIKKFTRGIEKAGAPESFSRGYWASQALCCGTPGLLLHFINAYKLTGEKDFLDFAKRTARFIIGQSFVEDCKEDFFKLANSRRWFGSWWRTIPQDVQNYTGLYVGTAGNAWSLLSLAALEKNETFVDIPESYYL